MSTRAVHNHVPRRPPAPAAAETAEPNTVLVTGIIVFWLVPDPAGFLTD